MTEGSGEQTERRTKTRGLDSWGRGTGREEPGERLPGVFPPLHFQGDAMFQVRRTGRGIYRIAARVARRLGAIAFTACFRRMGPAERELYEKIGRTFRGEGPGAGR